MAIHTISVPLVLDTTEPETLEFLSGIVTTACGGGVNYWASVDAYDPGNAAAVLRDLEDSAEDLPPTPLLLTVDVVAQGVKLVLEATPPFYDPNGAGTQCAELHYLSSHWASVIRQATLMLDAGEIDAAAADVIVQAALFGEIRYS